MEIELIRSKDGRGVKLTFEASRSAASLPILTKQISSAMKLASSATAYTVLNNSNHGAVLLLKFTNSVNQELKAKHQIKSFKNIDKQFLISMVKWAIKNDKKNFRRIADFRNVLKKAHLAAPNKIPNFIFPLIKKPKVNHHAPLTDDAANLLIDNLKKEIDKIRIKHKERMEWYEKAQPLEIENGKLKSDFSLNNLSWYYKNILNESLPLQDEIQRKENLENKKNYQNFYAYIRKCKSKEVNKLKLSEFPQFYKKNNLSDLAETGRPPTNGRTGGRMVVKNLDYSLKNIAWYFKYKLNEKTPTVKTSENLSAKEVRYAKIIISRFNEMIKKCPDPYINKIDAVEFSIIYKNKNLRKLADKGKSPCGSFTNKYGYASFHTESIAKTIYLSGFPFKINDKKFLNHLKNLANSSKQCTATTDIESLINIFILRYRARKSEHKGNIFYDRENISFIDFVNSLYVSPEEITTINLMFMIQTGWNLESVCKMDLNYFEHAISKGIDSDIALLVSSKRRGQGKRVPYVVEKKIIAPSDTKDKYSAYNLVRLFIEITEPLRHGKMYQDIVNELGYEPITIYLKTKSIKGLKYLEVLTSHRNNISAKNIIERFEIYENGKKLSGLGITARLRPTWLRLKKKTGASRTTLSMLMGHQHGDTKDIFYDNSAVAKADRIYRIEEELNAVDKSLRNKTFKGQLVPLTKKLKSNNKKDLTRDGHIFFDDENNRLISLCNNSSNPDWHGFEKYITSGEKCFYLRKCLHCSQSRITEDTLPYVIDRARYIDTQERILSYFEFSNLYADEKLAIDWILDNWINEKDIEEAEIFVDTNGPLLPADMLVPGFK